MMESSQKDEEVKSEEELREEEIKKCCADCKTTKTPLWRSGPSGPKSLCNACGIRYRKRRPTSAGGSDEKKGKSEKKKKNVKLRKQLKMNLMDFGREVDEDEEVEEEDEGQRSVVKRQRSGRQWGEVERAALLLMALSCGAVFA